MAAGDIKKPHVDVDIREYSPGTMRTRAVRPGEILVDGDGNPIGGTVVLPTDGEDNALAAIEALAADLREEIAQAARDALDGAIALIDGLDDGPGPVDVQEDTALAAIEALTAELHERVAQASQDAFDGAVALIDKLAAEVEQAEGEDLAALAALEGLREELMQAVQDAHAGAIALIEAGVADAIKTADAAASALVDAAVASLLAELQQVADDALASAIALFDLLTAKLEAAELRCKDEAHALVDNLDANLRSDLAQAVDDVFGGAVALIDKTALDLTAAAAEKADTAAEAVAENLQSALEQVADDAGAAVLAAEDRLNDRIGKRFWVTTTDATPTVIALLSPGIWRAMRIFAKVIGHRIDRAEAAIYNIIALARAASAFDVLTVGAPIADGETVTLDAITYTWRALPVAAYDVNIGATVEISIDNLVKAINLTGTPGVEYGPGTALHPTVAAVKTSVATMEAVAKFTGAAGNGIAATETMINGVWANGGAGLSGGADMALFGSVITTEYEDNAAWNAAITVSGSDVEILVTGGLPHVAWQAEVEILEHV